MSNPNAPSAQPSPESPELVAERERLVAELEKQAMKATGSLQQVLNKLLAVVSNSRPGVPANLQLYDEARAAFEQFAKEPVLPPPPIIMKAVEFMQRQAVAMGWTGQMQLPKGVPPPPGSGSR